MDPGTSERGSTTTTFEGAGVRVPGLTIPPPLPVFVPPEPGRRRSPVISPSVSHPITSRPAIARIGPTQSGTGATPYGSLGGGRRVVWRGLTPDRVTRRRRAPAPGSPAQARRGSPRP